MAFQGSSMSLTAYTAGNGNLTGARGGRQFIYGNPDGDALAVVSASNYFLAFAQSGELPNNQFGGVVQPKLSSGDMIFVPSLAAMLRLQLNSETNPTIVTAGVDGGFGSVVAANIANAVAATPVAFYTSPTLPVGRYRVKADVYYLSAAVTTGIVISSTTPGAVALTGRATATLAAATVLDANFVSATTIITSTASLTAGNLCTIDAAVTVAAAGVLTLLFTTEIDTSAITVLAGSTVSVLPN